MNAHHFMIPLCKGNVVFLSFPFPSTRIFREDKKNVVSDYMRLLLINSKLQWEEELWRPMELWLNIVSTLRLWALRHWEKIHSNLELFFPPIFDVKKIIPHRTVVGIV